MHGKHFGASQFFISLDSRRILTLMSLRFRVTGRLLIEEPLSKEERFRNTPTTEARFSSVELEFKIEDLSECT